MTAVQECLTVPSHLSPEEAYPSSTLWGKDDELEQVPIIVGEVLVEAQEEASQTTLLGKLLGVSFEVDEGNIIENLIQVDATEARGKLTSS